MFNETAEQNRYARAMTASIGRQAGPHDTPGHRLFFETNHRLLTEHAPADGENPECTDCGRPWPCGVASGAMAQVGVLW